MEEWKEYKLGDIGTIVGGATPSTKDPLNYDGNISWITPKDLSNFNGRYIGRGERMITTEGFNSSSCRMLPKGSVLFSSRAPIGYVAIAKNELCTNQGFKSVIPNPKIVDSTFLYYLLVFNKTRIEGLGSGTTFKEVSGQVMKNVSVLLPSLNTQQSIASVLSSIDDKIECNKLINDNLPWALWITHLILLLFKRKNDNLEQQAQALFKSWFVDFEPFKNGEFVESELGRIPKGWCVGVYNDIISDTVSGDWGKEKEEGNYTHRVACVRGCDFQDIKNGLRGKTPERFILEKNFQNKHFCDKDMLVEISGGTASVSTGRVCPVSQQLIDKYDGDIVCTNFCKLVRPKTGYGAYLYYSWLNKYSNKVMFGYENGTSGIKNFRIKDFTSIEPVILPPIKMVEEFQNHIDSIQKQIQTRGSESHNLAQIRDTLLPRLMSGELKVNEIEKSITI